MTYVIHFQQKNVFQFKINLGFLFFTGNIFFINWFLCNVEILYNEQNNVDLIKFPHISPWLVV